MDPILRGRAWCYGDNVDTDLIIPGKYLRLTVAESAKHAMEGIDPGFADRVRPGDLVVGGRNFGCGSSREMAPYSLKAAGVGTVIARSFGRIFFRNAINVGLPVVECADASLVSGGDELEVDLERGVIRNLTRDAVYQATPISGHLLTMIQAGGLVPYLEAQIRSGQLKPAPPPPLPSA